MTWNIATMEGQTAIAAMLIAQLAAQRPTGWHITQGEPAEEAGGVVQAWIGFETATGIGEGHIRLDLSRFRSGFLRAILAIKQTGYGSDVSVFRWPTAKIKPKECTFALINVCKTTFVDRADGKSLICKGSRRPLRLAGQLGGRRSL